MDKLYARVLRWSIMKLVNRQKTYQKRCNVYSDYSKEVKVNE